MGRLLTKVKALQVENEELKGILEQRDAEILTLSTDMMAKQQQQPPKPPAAPKRSPRSATHLASGLQGSLPLSRAFPAWPGSHGQLRHVPGSPGCPQPWPELRQPQSSGSAAWNVAARSLSLPHGDAAAAAPHLTSAVGCTEAPLLGRPLSMPTCESISVKSLPLPSSNIPSAEVNLAFFRGLPASGLPADAESEFLRGQNCHSLRLSSLPTQPLPVEGLSMSFPVGQLDGQPLQGRAFSCPPLRGPAVEAVGGTFSPRQLLQPQYGSYPLPRLHMPAHVNGRSLHAAPGFPETLAPADAAALDQMDFFDFWRGFD